jgi:hypothetical protein
MGADHIRTRFGRAVERPVPNFASGRRLLAATAF